MLKHPWLNREPNYDYKYTEKEYEIMMLKKDLKQKVKPTGAKGDEGREEMNELLDSDEELNAADDDGIRIFGDGSSGDEEDFWNFDEDDRSLMDSDEERDQVRQRKEKEPKINNSFTGPYPLDPTDFNHNDKGPNNQFEHLSHQ